MIGRGDVYKVVEGMVPLYVALILGYASIKWWRMFKSDHCNAINRFNCYFIMPFFTFQFTYGINPYLMNFRFLAGDVIAKAISGAVIALWANFQKKGNFAWAITSFSLSSFNNTLVVGVPLLRAMYGPVGEDLVVQSSVIQFLLWFPILLFMHEYRRTMCLINSTTIIDHDQPQHCSIEIVGADDNISNSVMQQPKPHQENNGTTLTEESTILSSSTFEIVAADHIDDTDSALQQLEGHQNNGNTTEKKSTIMSPSNYSFSSTMKKVWAKLAKNPNAYACALGLIWALIARRWDFEMPGIVDDSIEIMGKAGSGVAMFSIGLFMALQKKVIACGIRLTLYGMVLRFVGGPLAMTIGCVALGLRSNVLRIAIIQAALPQAIASFTYAQEYGLHANVLSTTVIFGTIVSLPLLILYYLGLDILH